MKSVFVEVESLYGPSFLSINTHLHLHLQEIFKDYGPCYGFWLLSFERYNGILGKYHTNQLSIEIQLMRRFIESVQIRSLANSSTIGSEHFPIFEKLTGPTSGGSAADTLFGETTFLAGSFTNLSSLQGNGNVALLSLFVLYRLDDAAVPYLRVCYSAIVPNVNILEILQLCCKYRTARWWSQYLKSSEYPAKISCCILANWAGENGQITDDSTVVSAGRVEYFIARDCK